MHCPRKFVSTISFGVIAYIINVDAFMMQNVRFQSFHVSSRYGQPLLDSSITTSFAHSNPGVHRPCSFPPMTISRKQLSSSSTLRTSICMQSSTGSQSAALAIFRKEDSQPIKSTFGVIKVKGMDFNIPLGVAFIISVFGWVILCYPPLLLAYSISMLLDQKRRRAVDWIVGLWAKMAMISITYSPTVVGIENLPPASEAVMYIPNHCSYLDIFTLSGFLPRPFKYVSKIEVLRIPLIGWAMQLAGHIAIERNDKRSQLQTFKDTVQALQDGSSVVTFAEGTRSKDGKLANFKKGPIKMAIKAGVRVVPVSIANLHRWMPDSALSPLSVPRRVVVTIHPPIDPSAAGGEDAAVAAIFNAVNSALPDFQRADSGRLGAATD